MVRTLSVDFYDVNILLGITTTLIILAHELPQEMGLFGVLVYGGYEKKKALLYSFLAQATCILGGIVGFLAATKIEAVSLFLVPFAAGGFIYIAASDLVPEMHRMYKGKFKESLKTILVFIAGILLMLGD
jgi:zinc and cadmium transporter